MAGLHVSQTRIIRTPAAGPEPCNTLAFLRCLVPGADVAITPNSGSKRLDVKFSTEFRLDGYLQSQFDWYRANTLVSASASLRFLNTTTDLTFCMAVDHVTPELQQLDGSLAFICGLMASMEDDALFGGYEELVLTASLTAYVLCFEPRVQMPPSGLQSTPWAQRATERLKSSELLKKTTRLPRDGTVRRTIADC
ncbi:MAG: hypothetical protein QOE31_1774 [Solirubrobacteraceae bacterium]|nr:hypothetical protein [Solirubrobacteraceae bacterium]